MLGRIRAHLTYANVMATLAVFIALGGVAYAGATITGSDVVDGSLTNLDYKNNDIRSGDVRNDTSAGGGLTALDLATDSVGAAEIAEHEISLEETKIGFVNDFQYMSQNNTLLDTTVSKELQVPCHNGGEVSGGGFVIAGPNGSNVPSVVVQRSYAVDKSTWLVRAVAQSGTPQWQLTVVANCVAQ
jgi:hypothetical protein